jgi:hypothetical protein
MVQFLSIKFFLLDFFNFFFILTKVPVFWVTLYKDKHKFVDGRNYKATVGLWKLLTNSQPDNNTVTVQDRQAYKQTQLQSNTHTVCYRLAGNNRANRWVKYTRFIFPMLSNTPESELLWESL